MIDPLSIGAMIAALAASKAAEKAGEAAVGKLGEKAAESGWGLGSKIVGRVRGWFDDNGEAEGLAALEAVEASGDVESAEAKTLAEVVGRELKPASKVATDLDEWLTLARQDQVLAPLLNQVSITQTKTNEANVSGTGHVVVQDVNGSVDIRQTNQ